MIKVIRPPQAKKDKKYQPPLTVGWGIDRKTVPGVRNTMAKSIVPPGGRNQRHFHVATDALWYILKGRLKIFFGMSAGVGKTYDMLKAAQKVMFPITAEKAAEDIYRAIRARKQQIYTPWFWSWIMLAIRNMPSVLFRRMSF